jgi:hypothetical protein
MFLHPPRNGDAHWVYDDPSGVPEAPFTTGRGRALGSIELAAPRGGLTPPHWLSTVVSRSLHPAFRKAA